MGYHGGLYVDATTHCTAPLDSWIFSLLLQGHFVGWDANSDLPSANFLYSSAPSQQLRRAFDEMPPYLYEDRYGSDPEDDGYLRMIVYLHDVVFNGVALPNAAQFIERQLCVSICPPGMPWVNPNDLRLGTGVKLMANDWPEGNIMAAPADAAFLNSVRRAPYQKLTWKYNNNAMPLNERFPADSRLWAIFRDRRSRRRAADATLSRLAVAAVAAVAAAVTAAVAAATVAIVATVAALANDASNRARLLPLIAIATTSALPASYPYIGAGEAAIALALVTLISLGLGIPVVCICRQRILAPKNVHCTTDPERRGRRGWRRNGDGGSCCEAIIGEGEGSQIDGTQSGSL